VEVYSCRKIFRGHSWNRAADGHLGRQWLSFACRQLSRPAPTQADDDARDLISTLPQAAQLAERWLDASELWVQRTAWRFFD
jgi:hypothetical protein